jgi:uncharacterized protein YkwD
MVVFVQASIALLATVSNCETGAANLRQDGRSLAPTYTSSTQYVPAMVTRLNKERVAHGLPPLCSNHKLQAAAERHVKDQSYTDYMSDFGRDSSTPKQRVTDASYKWQSVVESIDAVAANVDSVVDWWMKMKRGHVLGNYTMVGMAYAFDGRTRNKHHWVQVYATGSSETCDDG